MNTKERVRRRIVSDERGVVLVFVVLLMFVLFGFAALAVDLGAAWAERRQDQSAADAAAMAAAIEYIQGAPTDEEIVDIVKDFVEKNIGYPVDGAGWGSCPSPTDGFIPLPGTNCVSLKQSQTLANDVLVKVRVPTQEVPTSFARLIGIDSVSVSAEAIARIEANPGARGALPFALPTGLTSGQEYCMGTPPPGQARDQCNGQNTGLFGTINSPFFGADDDPWGTVGCSDQPTNRNTRVQWNTALGVDHFLRKAPDFDPVAPGLQADPSDPSWEVGRDDCDASLTTPAQIPYSLVADNGSLQQVSDGFIGSGPYGSLGLPGRLRQAPSGTPERSLVLGGPELENVGLWTYLDNGDITDTGDPCHTDYFNTSTYTGTELTANLVACLDNPDSVKFTSDLLSSKRFGIAPVVNLPVADIGDIPTANNAGAPIVEFAPLYIQAAWFKCGGSNSGCVDFESDDGVIQQSFEPGEGSTPGVVNGSTPALDGITVFLLTNPDWLPSEFDNQFNDPGGFNVYLYR